MIISSEKSAFLKFELENGSDQRKKIALQEISRLYRTGQRLNAEGRNSFEKLINGMVLTQENLKVVRWCLNALARLGSRQNSGRYVAISLKQHEDKPEVVAAAIAALSQMYNGELAAVPELKSIDPRMQTLAAMQVTDPKKLDIGSLNINIDKVDNEVLKLALILVGLNRDVDNLFHPRHSNGQIVKVLGQSDDSVVRQYSVWSVLENNKLSIDDLGIPFTQIDKQPPNVQAKLLQLAAEKERNKIYRHQIIHDGSFNGLPEAREGLAKGLMNTYYNGLEDITINWFDNEHIETIKELLAEHFARYSDDCGPYSDKALTIVECEPGMKARILLGAEGKALYSAIKASDIREGTPDLFGTADDLPLMFQGGARLLGKKREAKKVLFLASNPIDQQSLRLDKEAAELREQLSLVKRGKVEIIVEHAWAVRADQIQMELLNNKPEILHFSGHGDVGALIVEDYAGNTTEVSAAALAELVSLCPSIKCVVLNACYSESVARLISPYVETVIGCDASIDDEAAVLFSRAFYRALAHDCGTEGAFRLAVNDVRLNGREAEAKKYKIYNS